MQLYILDRSPGNSARFLADVHVIKMCLETVQIISGVINNLHLFEVPGMVKPYNPRHPVITAVDTPEKLNWLLVYNWNLQCEFLWRFKKKHAFFQFLFLTIISVPRIRYKESLPPASKLP